MLNSTNEIKPGYDLGEHDDFLVFVRPPMDRFWQLFTLGWVRYSYGNLYSDFRDVRVLGHQEFEEVNLNILDAINYLVRSHTQTFIGLQDYAGEVGEFNRIEKYKELLKSNITFYSNDWEEVRKKMWDLRGFINA